MLTRLATRAEEEKVIVTNEAEFGAVIMGRLDLYHLASRLCTITRVANTNLGVHSPRLDWPSSLIGKVKRPLLNPPISLAWCMPRNSERVVPKRKLHILPFTVYHTLEIRPWHASRSKSFYAPLE